MSVGHLDHVLIHKQSRRDQDVRRTSKHCH